MSVRERLHNEETLHGWRDVAWAEHAKLDPDLLTVKQDAGVDVQRADLLREEWEKAGTGLAARCGPDYAWSLLHQIEEGVAEVASDALLVAYARRALRHVKSPAMKGHDREIDKEALKVVKQVAAEGTLGGLDVAKVREQVATVLEQCHDVTDAKHASANDQRRRMWAVTAVAVALSSLVVVAAVVLNDLPFLVGADSFAEAATIQVALLVALGGLVGGSWGAFPALMSRTRDEFRIGYARAAARMAMGLLAALIGVSLVGAMWVAELSASSAPALFAVALAFGLTQEPVTRILEAKANGSSEATPGDRAP